MIHKFRVLNIKDDLENNILLFKINEIAKKNNIKQHKVTKLLLELGIKALYENAEKSEFINKELEK